MIFLIFMLCLWSCSVSAFNKKVLEYSKNEKIYGLISFSDLLRKKTRDLNSRDWKPRTVRAAFATKKRLLIFSLNFSLHLAIFDLIFDLLFDLISLWRFI